jgi:YHS domain-containing protein
VICFISYWLSAGTPISFKPSSDGGFSQGQATLTTTEPLSLARTHHDHPADVPGEVRDPVCGMTIKSATVAQRTEHAGHQYFFCSAKCRERFTADQGRYLTPRHSSDLSTAPSAAGEILWTCPMHPQIVRKEPGSCPICGMTLERLTHGGRG